MHHTARKKLSATLIVFSFASLIVLSIITGMPKKQSSMVMKIMRSTETLMDKDRPLAIAHRGFRGIAPENTLLAAKLGYEAGADMWELDVAASRDGVLVVLHDDTLVRTTDAASRFPDRKPWKVYDFTIEELKSLDAGTWYGITDPFGQIRSGRVSAATVQTFSQLKIPTLKEALELTKNLNWSINIEIKDATGQACDTWIVEKTAELIRELEMSGNVLVSSFNHSYLKRMKKAAPEISVAVLIDKPVPDPVTLLRDIEAIALNPNQKYLDLATVHAVRAAGFGVFPWTVNLPADMKRLLDWGVTGIITDFPDEAKKLIASSL